MQFVLSDDKKFIKIIKADSVDELDQLRLSLTKKVKDYRFLPSVKNKMWDGNITFLDKNDKVLSGLWKYCYDQLTKYNYECKLYKVKDLFDYDINKDEFIEFVNDFFANYKLKPREYQIDASFNILKYRRCGSLLSTSSGKTFVIFMFLAYAQHKNLIKKTLMIVPNVSLVIQAYKDFTDYNQGKIKFRIQKIYSGEKPVTRSNLVIGTYQSLVKKPEKYFQQFDSVIIDECHKTSSVSISKIMNFFWHKNVNYKIGLSGTYPDEKTANYLTILAHTGPIVNDVNSDTLIQKGFVTPVKITIIKMDYADKETKEAFYTLSKEMEAGELYQKEKKYVTESTKRLNFVVKLISKATKNTLVLFHLIEHGKKLFEEISKEKHDVFYIDGTTKVDIREHYKKEMEKDNKKLYIVFEFDEYEIKIKEDENVLLSNGTYKKAKDIKLDDDIDDEFINRNK